ncbi:MAG: 3'-5' exonuclease [Rhodocyclaceae bacterium]
MSWISRLLGAAPDLPVLPPELRQRLDAWAALPVDATNRRHFETRYVIVNTEATGRSVTDDRLLAIAAIAIEDGALAADRAIHASLPPEPAAELAHLLEFAGKSPIVVFNAAFNRVLLENALERHLGRVPDWFWLDLYWILHGLFRPRATTGSRLADWMQQFGIETFQRHHALGDAYAIAQLLLLALGRARMLGVTTPEALSEFEARARREALPR